MTKLQIQVSRMISHNIPNATFGEGRTTLGLVRNENEVTVVNRLLGLRLGTFVQSKDGTLVWKASVKWI